MSARALPGALALAVAVSAAATASAATSVHVSLLGKRPALTVGRAWTARLAVQPVTFRGRVQVIATGPGRVQARASGRRGSYRARLVFPKAGRWALRARAGGSVSRLGSVQVRAPRREPLAFTEPTSIELEPAGTLLLVENSLGRLLRVDPATGSVTVLASSLTRPYAVARGPSGAIYLSIGNELQRIDGGGTPVTVVNAQEQIGPITVAANGDVYYATATRIFCLPGGVGPPVHVAGTGVEGGAGDGGAAVDAQIAGPHGLGLAADGALLVSDSRNNRVRRIDQASGLITALAQIVTPVGMDVAANGTIYVIDGEASRVLRLTASGERIGFVGPAFRVPYDIESAPDGAVYVLEAGSSGRVRRVAPDGSVTTVSHS